MGLFTKKKSHHVPMSLIVQQPPNSECWIVTKNGLGWEVKQYMYNVPSFASNDFDTYQTGGRVETNEFKARPFIQKLLAFQAAWFDGRIYNNKADCQVAANERNLQEAERLMNRSIEE